MANGNRDKTVAAVQSQIRAMGSEVFEVGLFKPDARDREPVMLPRTWDHDSLLRSIGWLRHENCDGRNIYVRPKGEHNLSLVDDLMMVTIAEMTRSGFSPAAVVETSPGNFQAWLKHPERLSKELGTAAARALAQRFGGDRGAADWRHFGRLRWIHESKTQPARYTNRSVSVRRTHSGYRRNLSRSVPISYASPYRTGRAATARGAPKNCVYRFEARRG